MLSNGIWPRVCCLLVNWDISLNTSASHRRRLDPVPNDYDDTYKWYTRQGSRVLALGVKEMVPLSLDKVGVQPYPTFFFAYLFGRSTNFTGQLLKAS